MTQTAETEVEQVQGDEQQDAQGNGESQAGADGGEGGDDELVITIGGATPPQEEDDEHQAAPPWVKDLRKANRDKDKELRELKQRLADKEAAAKPAAGALTKPTLEDCGYDEAEFERRFSEFQTQQSSVAEARRKKEVEEKEASDAWATKVNSHQEKAKALKQKDYEEMESDVTTQFSQMQQGILIDAADDSALIVYALGKYPAKLKELAAITNPVKFAFALAKLEMQLKATPRKTPPPAENAQRGSAPITAGATSKELARLEAEADKTGDRSKVIAYRRQQKQKA